MINDEIELKIIEALNNVGILFDATELETLSFEEVIPDSLSFISFIVELEQIFNIEIPDEFLMPERISSFVSIRDMIKGLLS